MIKSKLVSNRSYAIVLLIPILLMGTFSIGNNNILQSVSAQETNGTVSFSVSGYTGQILTLPPSITQVEASQNESALGPSIGSVIGGNWSFNVVDGQLENFTWNATSYTLGGEVEGTFSIDEISDAGPLDTAASDLIQLDGNSTAFTGSSDIVINGETVFSDVPVVLYILNGNIASLTLSHQETEGIFTVPLYGIVTSLT
ncbi:MAG: hypothetical protein L0H53_02950 [Candidatus Nitrosocosmicus sp.]|nr:hypothetical protein [Candidatus Nitrosocosmicus sp.]MDN5866390.1 hypothetical protein [Candidatus Nitrosocosmicus sp.]